MLVSCVPTLNSAIRSTHSPFLRRARVSVEQFATGGVPPCARVAPPLLLPPLAILAPPVPFEVGGEPPAVALLPCDPALAFALPPEPALIAGDPPPFTPPVFTP